MAESLKDEAVEWIKDIVVAAIIISLIMGALYAYTGTWPPMVVVESESMQHSDDTSYIGVIDTGDIVLSKSTSSRHDIITYVTGRATGYRAYGDYGDVVIYRPYGLDTTPIIHRAVVYLVWNSTGHSYDAPELRHLEYGVDYSTDSGGWSNIRDRITINNYGYAHRTVEIPISLIIRYFDVTGRAPHSGYITAGDHNIAKGHGVDQPDICREPIKYEWIIGKAEGELPWFGIIKLMFSGTLSAHPAPANSWIMLIVSIALLIVVPMIVEKAWDRYKERREKRGGEIEGLESDEESPGKSAPPPSVLSPPPSNPENQEEDAEKDEDFPVF